MKGKLFCLIGVSGVGKSQVRKFCIEKITGLEYLPSYTTRPPRLGEEDGKDYFYISKEEFENLISDKKLLEWEKHFDNYYGIDESFFFRKLNAGVSLIKEIAIGGYEQLLKTCPKELLYSIYLQPENLSDVVDHITDRGDLDGQKRINSFNEELKGKGRCDKVVISEHGGLDLLCNTVEIIIRSLI